MRDDTIRHVYAKMAAAGKTIQCSVLNAEILCVSRNRTESHAAIRSSLRCLLNVGALDVGQRYVWHSCC